MGTGYGPGIHHAFIANSFSTVDVLSDKTYSVRSRTEISLY